MAPSTPDREWLDDDGIEIEDHDRGLMFDLHTLVDRRRALTLFGGLGVAGALAACGTSGTSTAVGTSSGAPSGASSATSSAAAATSAATSATSSTEATTDAVLVEAPDETAGPYPG